jgi:hypothetical protein
MVELGSDSTVEVVAGSVPVIDRANDRLDRQRLP